MSVCLLTAALMTGCGNSPTQPCAATLAPEPPPSIVIPLACPEHLTPLADPTLGACYETTVENAEIYYACRKAMGAR